MWRNHRWQLRALVGLAAFVSVVGCSGGGGDASATQASSITWTCKASRSEDWCTCDGLEPGESVASLGGTATDVVRVDDCTGFTPCTDSSYDEGDHFCQCTLTPGTLEPPPDQIVDVATCPPP